MVIEDCATKAFRDTPILLDQLVTTSRKSQKWKKTKLALQERVLLYQIEGLKRFAGSKFSMALMDRGGASTAYHTLPLLTSNNKEAVEATCEEIARMGQIIFFSSLGILEKDSRYQKTLREISAEHRGIKHYLNRWKMNYLEINPIQKAERLKIGTLAVLDLANNLFKVTT